MISRTVEMSQPYTCSASPNSSTRSEAFSAIVSVEAKVFQRIRMVDQCARPFDRRQRLREIRRQRCPEIDLLVRLGVAEPEPRRVQEVSLRRQRHQATSSPSAVAVVADDRMPDGGEMNADLVGA